MQHFLPKSVRETNFGGDRFWCDSSLDGDTSLHEVSKDRSVADEETIRLGAGEVEGGGFETSREALNRALQVRRFFQYINFVLVSFADFVGKFVFLCNSGDNLGIKFL